MTARAVDWPEANQRYLAASLAVIRAELVGDAVDEARAELEKARTLLPAPSALDALGTSFGLSPFERDVLVLCAGVELDASFEAAVADASGGVSPTFGLALGALPDAHWSALAPAAPLRRWRLVEIGDGKTVATSPLRIDERVLHHLAGVSYLDERLRGLVEPLEPPAELLPTQEAVASRLATLWSGHGDGGAVPVVQLCGEGAAFAAAVAAAAGATLGLRVHAIRASCAPAAPAERDALARLWEREAALGAAALVLENDRDEDGPAATALAETIRGPLAIAGRDALPLRRPSIRLELARPSADEQRGLWERGLGPRTAELNGRIELIVSHFSLAPATIAAACADALGRLESGAAGLDRLLWDACRAQARPRLEGLAQRIEPLAGWDDLVLPAPQLRTLREVAAHVRRRAVVYERWGFAARSPRGLGISALFAGPSGTGKTMAAEVIARELGLDLYRIDLSSVVSKYIGETEKNLRRVFDAAEEGGAMLLFDEADALFGKRSEVKDSHDRYANIEVSYLLQRMEAYRGLAVLTTNLKSALDTAFLRRIRFVVQFPFPDLEQRADIWRRVFPPETPREGLDEEKLARLNVAGGNIRNIALNAAFLAADAGEPVCMEHLLRAARSEYAKLERPLTEAEIGGWS